MSVIGRNRFLPAKSIRSADSGELKGMSNGFEETKGTSGHRSSAPQSHANEKLGLKNN